jgi:poly(beta-D-mannuronate) lyase
LAKTNNHSYWAAWSVMAASVALNRQDLFNWSVKEYRIAAGQIEADGTLPNERKRRERAAAYHNYALQPLVMHRFAQANGVDLLPENQYALQRLANWVLQHDNRNVDWLAPYCTLTKCDSAFTARCQSYTKNRRMAAI